jgi:ribosomal protein S27E
MKLPFDPKKIKPGSFSYLTKRRLKNKEGEEKGEIFLWKKVDEEESNYLMRCPFCGEEREGKVLLLKRPFKVECPACGKSINLPRLRY